MIMKHLFFIDYENLPGDIVNRLIDVTPRDSWYYVFYSSVTPTPEYVLNHLPDKPVTVRFVNCSTGSHDAMDFQIVAMVSRMSTIHPNACYHIVSNDHGYQAPIRYLQTEGIRIMLDKPPATEVTVNMNFKEKYRKCIETALESHDRTKSEINRLCAAICYSVDLAVIHKAVQTQYKDKSVKLISPIYQSIKAALHKEKFL